MKPAVIENQKDFDGMTFTERKILELQLKSWNIKKDKVLDNMCRLFLYLWNQCTLALKSKIKFHPKHAAAEKIKDTVQFWMLIEEVYTNTSIN